MHSQSIRVLALVLCLFVSAVAAAQDMPLPSSASATTAKKGVRVDSTSPCRQSPISPDGPSDADFTLDCGPSLDRYMFNDAGEMLIDVEVTRVVGNVSKLKSAGMINQHVKLSIAAFDVDVPMERDRVKFNGHEVGFLDGKDGEWVLNEFLIPVEWVDFPSDGGVNSVVNPASNIVEIEIDIDNPTFPAWAAQVDWASLHVYVTRPILLAHGALLGNAQGWNQLWSPRLTAMGIPHHAISMDPLGGINQNGDDIAVEVAKLKRAWGVDKIHIQAHSMGGIWSRGFVERDDSVEKLVMVATPNGGTPLADLTFALTFDPLIEYFLNKVAPVRQDATTLNMFLYNQAHGHNPSVGYTAIAGYWKPKWYTTSAWRIGTWIVGKGDAIVPIWSVHTLPYTDNFTKRTDGGNKDAVHTHQINSGAFFDIAFRPIRSAMPQGPPLPPPGPGEGDDPDHDPGKPHRLKSLGASIATGQTQSHSILVDESSPIDFAVGHYPGDSISLTLISPSGQRYDATSSFPEGAGFDADSELGSAPMPMFHFDEPEIGEWTIEVTANAIAATSAPGAVATHATPETQYVVFGFMPEQPVLDMNVELEKPAVRRNEPLTLRASIRKNGIAYLGVAVRAEVAAPNGARSVVTLHDDGTSGDPLPGDGVYVASIPTPAGGSYAFNVVAEENRVGATPFRREGEAIGVVSVSQSTLDAPYTDEVYDLDGDHGADVLVVAGFLNLDMAGTYTVLGTLTDLSGNPVTTISERIDAGSAGRARYELSFHGSGIYNSRLHGPYRVSVKLFEERGGIAQIDEQTNVHTTRAYQWYLFQAPPPEALAPTNMTVNSVSSVYGGKVNLYATLFTQGQPLAGKLVIFSQRSSTLGSAITDENGVARIDNANISPYYGGGTHELRASFGGDPVYEGSSAAGIVQVRRAQQTIVWADPADITPMSELGPDQLNAVVNVVGPALAGELTYDPPAGTIMYEGDNQPLTVVAASTPFYDEATKTVHIHVRRPSAQLNWNTPAPITYGTPLTSAQLNATANMSGTYIYTPVAGTVLNAGTHVLHVTFYPNSHSFLPASKTVTLTVTKAEQTIAWSNPAPIVYGTPLGATQLNATGAAVTYSPAAGTILDAGTHTLTATAAETATHSATTKSVTLIVTKANQTIAWSNPAPIVYGTPLGAAQLNATATGALTYSPNAGTILDAGTHTLTATAAETANYNAATKSVTLTVAKANQTITWSNPAPIVYGTPLGAAQLNATAPGALTYSPAAGTILNAGTHTLSVSAAETANYNAATASVTLVVTKANQTITWATPASIVYGTALSATQLNATATAGALTYSPAAGTILDAGTHTLSVSAAETANYNAATASVTLVVTKANQTITWATPASIVYGTPLGSAQLNATATAGALTYTPAAGTVLDAGTHTLSVTVAETANYNAANASVTLVVTKANQTITWATPASIVYGTPLSNAQLNATATAGALTYSPTAGTILNAGNHTLSVTAAETANYNAATASVTLVVAKANQTITWATPAPIVYGTPLSNAQLNATATAGALTYSPAAGTILDAGNHTLSVTAAETANYNAANASVALTVAKATPSLTWSNPSSIVYGTALSGAQLNATADVAGMFTYTPAAGTVLDAGTHTLSVAFAPDSANYESATRTVTLEVAKANQTITWSNPSSIVYGTALSGAQLNATATAGALTYTPAAGTVLDAGSHTLSVTAAETANYNAASSSVTIAVTRAPLSLIVDAKSKIYGSALPALTGTLTGVVNNDPIAPTYATTATVASPTGTYPITGALTDPAARLGNYEVHIAPATLTVTPAALLISANDAAKQYSDPLPPLTASFHGFVLGETPAVLSGALVIQTTATPLSGPGAYPIAIGGLTSSNYAIAYAGGTLTVTQEDALVTFTAPLVATTTMTLSATVQDVSDDAPGDIRKATLTFVNRANGETLCSAPIGLISSSTGVATCNAPATTNVGIVIGGWYVRDSASDDVVITIAAPTADSISGAGWLTLTGAIGADEGSRADVNVAKSGRFSMTYLNGNRKYELETTSITTLAITRTAKGGIATIVGIATLRDITDAKSPVVLDAAAPVAIVLTDDGEPSTNDNVVVTAAKANGGLWLSTKWNGTRTVALPLVSGNLQVHQK